MIRYSLIFQFFVLAHIILLYFRKVIFISHGYWPTDELKIMNITAELQERLPEYRVHSGCYYPPCVMDFIWIAYLNFRYKGFRNVISRRNRKTLEFRAIGFIILYLHIMSPDGFEISYEGQRVYSRQSSEIDIPNVDQLVDIIKENVPAISIPGLVFLALFTWLCIFILHKGLRIMAFIIPERYRYIL